VAQQYAPGPCADAWTISEVRLEITAPAVDEVVPHVRRTIGRRAAGGSLTGALDRFQGHAHLAFASRLR
jgi:hypothetical protein